jgi:hypothetical protein
MIDYKAKFIAEREENDRYRGKIARMNDRATQAEARLSKAEAELLVETQLRKATELDGEQGWANAQWFQKERNYWLNAYLVKK